MSDRALINPIVVDLGKVKRKRIKDLKRGQGKLMEEVHDVVEEVRAELGENAAGKELVPVIMCYRQKPSRRDRRRRRRRDGFLLPFLD